MSTCAALPACVQTSRSDAVPPVPPVPKLPTVLILGSGLIGCSIGLALTQEGSYDVLLADRDARALQVAIARGAGRPWDGAETVEVVVAAGPPGAIGHQLHDVQRLNIGQTYTHVSSVQSQVQREVEALGCDLSSIVGGHPLAGRETSGPEGSSAELFVGRPWAVCASPSSTPSAVARVWALATACGASPLAASPAEHDRAVALLSHLPQVAASALAALLVRGVAEAGTGPTHSRPLMDLSGNGLADTTRIAASSAPMWTDILTGNAAELAPLVRDLATLLSRLATDLDTSLVGTAATGQATTGTELGTEASVARRRVQALLEAGNLGRAMVPVKRGVREAGFALVAVEVDDQPGRLAALLTAAGAGGFNVEDVRVDHVPGRATGVIELLVARETAPAVAAALQAAGWRVVSASLPH